jgi:hypothetical protein
MSCPLDARPCASAGRGGWPRLRPQLREPGRACARAHTRLPEVSDDPSRAVWGSVPRQALAQQTGRGVHVACQSVDRPWPFSGQSWAPLADAWRASRCCRRVHGALQEGNPYLNGGGAAPQSAPFCAPDDTPDHAVVRLSGADGWHSRQPRADRRLQERLLHELSADGPAQRRQGHTRRAAAPEEISVD